MTPPRPEVRIEDSQLLTALVQQAREIAGEDKELGPIVLHKLLEIHQHNKQQRQAQEYQAKMRALQEASGPVNPPQSLGYQVQSPI